VHDVGDRVEEADADAGVVEARERDGPPPHGEPVARLRVGGVDLREEARQFTVLLLARLRS